MAKFENQNKGKKVQGKNNTRMKKPEKIDPFTVTKTSDYLVEILRDIYRINPAVGIAIVTRVPSSLHPEDYEYDQLVGEMEFDDLVESLSNFFFKDNELPKLTQGKNYRAAFQCSCNRVYIRPANNWSFEVKAMYHVERDEVTGDRYAVIDQYVSKYTAVYGGYDAKFQHAAAHDLGWTDVER